MKNLMFPEDELDDIRDILEDADLNGEFPFDAKFQKYIVQD